MNCWSLFRLQLLINGSLLKPTAHTAAIPGQRGGPVGTGQMSNQSREDRLKEPRCGPKKSPLNPTRPRCDSLVKPPVAPRCVNRLVLPVARGGARGWGSLRQGGKVSRDETE